MGKQEMHLQLWLENLKRKDHIRDFDGDGNAILKCILEGVDCI
jgi:hypothetical protein